MEQIPLIDHRSDKCKKVTASELGEVILIPLYLVLWFHDFLLFGFLRTSLGNSVSGSISDLSIKCSQASLSGQVEVFLDPNLIRQFSSTPPGT